MAFFLIFFQIKLNKEELMRLVFAKSPNSFKRILRYIVHLAKNKKK